MRKTTNQSRLEALEWAIGRYPDAVVADIAGISRQRVQEYRKKRGLDAGPSASEFARFCLRMDVESRWLTNSMVDDTINTREEI